MGLASFLLLINKMASFLAIVMTNHTLSQLSPGLCEKNWIFSGLQLEKIIPDKKNTIKGQNTPDPYTLCIVYKDLFFFVWLSRITTRVAYHFYNFH